MRAVSRREAAFFGGGREVVLFTRKYSRSEKTQLFRFFRKFSYLRPLKRCGLNPLTAPDNETVWQDSLFFIGTMKEKYTVTKIASRFDSI